MLCLCVYDPCLSHPTQFYSVDGRKKDLSVYMKEQKKIPDAIQVYNLIFGSIQLHVALQFAPLTHDNDHFCYLNEINLREKDSENDETEHERETDRERTHFDGKGSEIKLHYVYY